MQHVLQGAGDADEQRADPAGHRQCFLMPGLEQPTEKVSTYAAGHDGAGIDECSDHVVSFHAAGQRSLPGVGVSSSI